jgi:hypothetical protein
MSVNHVDEAVESRRADTPLTNLTGVTKIETDGATTSDANTDMHHNQIVIVPA